MEGALGAAMEARVALFVAAQALGPEPEAVIDRLLVDCAAQAATYIFGFTYENALHNTGRHSPSPVR
ncbi:hypothetical protein D3C79_991020 [compost metagenome]